MACDLEPIATRPATIWRDLLGAERFALADVIAHATDDDPDTAATRVWAAAECLKKAGAIADTPLVLAADAGQGWVLLAAGSLAVATVAVAVGSSGEKLVVAVLAGGETCAPTNTGTWSASRRRTSSAMSTT
jgi:enediyne polyketide synthase